MGKPHKSGRHVPESSLGRCKVYDVQSLLPDGHAVAHGNKLKFLHDYCFHLPLAKYQVFDKCRQHVAGNVSLSVSLLPVSIHTEDITNGVGFTSIS
jgi:hypothetical protein